MKAGLLRACEIVRDARRRWAATASAQGARRKQHAYALAADLIMLELEDELRHATARGPSHPNCPAAEIAGCRYPACGTACLPGDVDE